MKFLALALAILNMYAPVAEYREFKNDLGLIQQAIVLEVRNDILDYLRKQSDLCLSTENQQKLWLLLEKHNTNSMCDCEMLQQFLLRCEAEKLDSMVETIMKMYAPVSDMAGHYNSLSRGDKCRVTRTENKIIDVLKSKYKFSWDIDSLGDFLVLIRNHGKDNKSNRSLMRNFFSGAKSKIFDQLASIVMRAKKGANLTELRRSLQSDPKLFGFDCVRKQPRLNAPCHCAPVFRQKGFMGGKNKRL